MDHAPPTLVPHIRFREVQHIARNTLVLVLLPSSFVTITVIFACIAATQPGQNHASLLYVWLGMLAFDVALMALLRQETLVTDDELVVRFSPFYRRRVPLAEIDACEPVRYEPLTDTGGWGVRRSRKHGRVINAYGDRAVSITAGDERLLIGTQRPEELAAAIRGQG